MAIVEFSQVMIGKISAWPQDILGADKQRRHVSKKTSILIVRRREWGLGIGLIYKARLRYELQLNNHGWTWSFSFLPRMFCHNLFIALQEKHKERTSCFKSSNFGLGSFVWLFKLSTTRLWNCSNFVADSASRLGFRMVIMPANAFPGILVARP